MAEVATQCVQLDVMGISPYTIAVELNVPSDWFLL